MIKPGDIISYNEMCLEEGYSLQRGMNFQVNGGISVILMSLRKNAPYADRVEENGRVLIYEGHDVPKNISNTPKLVDQPRKTPNGSLTQNGKFEAAAIKFKNGIQSPELVKVYEKIKPGIWVYKIFWYSTSTETELKNLDHNRLIPTSVKIEVWKRDKGRCVQCGSTDNLHFDHILPFSKGGTSLKAENIQLLCARHNLKKSDKIM